MGGIFLEYLIGEFAKITGFSIHTLRYYEKEHLIMPARNSSNRRCYSDKDIEWGYRNPTGFRRWVKVAKSGGLCYTCDMGTWKSKNRHKYLLQYHVIFVCKYRKKLLASKQISDDIKQFSYEICQKHHVITRYNGKSVKTLG